MAVASLSRTRNATFTGMVTAVSEPNWSDPALLARFTEQDGTSGSDFAAVAIQDVHSATLSFGNHVCKPRVCHKGRIGRMGFCRMMFWHWARVPRKTSGKRKRDNDGNDGDLCAKR